MHLNGIRAYGYTGALPEEQVLGQWFQVDLTLQLDFSVAGQSDRLEHTLDYRQVIAGVQTLVKTAHFTLLERLATAIAERVFQVASEQRIPLEQVQVRLTKPAPPIPDFAGAIVIELTRPYPGQTETPLVGDKWG